MSVDIGVGLDVAGLDRDHPSFELATQEFISDARETPELEVSEQKKSASDADAATPGTKSGIVQELILIASAPSSAAAVVSLVKLWLRRDRHRSISLEIRPSGKAPVTVQASGDNISLETLEKVVESSLNELG
jgi:hypothetical protein